MVSEMKENEPYQWKEGDTTKSLRDIIAIGKLAVAQIINRLSGVNDENNKSR